MKLPIFQSLNKKLTWSGLRNRHATRTRKADHTASSSSQQQVESFSGVDKKARLQSSDTTSCVQINETPSSSEAGKDEPYICPRCERIDLPNLFSSQNPPKRVSLQHDDGYPKLDPKCCICRLLRLSWPDSPLMLPPFLELWDNRIRSFTLSGTHGRLGMIQEVPPAAINNFVESKIGFPLLKSWIEDCSHNHGPECAANWDRDSIPGLKLIKIKERRIVNASKEGGPYAALSYVWGTGPQGTPQGDKLPAEMPKTIVDAMNVSLELDLDYLWIDRYCIRQDDSEEKYDQISKMHHIFRQSHVTIVAAAGDSPNHGIPGMSIPRTSQPYTTINGRLFVGLEIIQGLMRKLPESKWHTRAWTYQEQILSRRFILFTDSQSFFHCNQTQVPWNFGIEDPIRNLATDEIHRLPCILASKFGSDYDGNYRQRLLREHLYEISHRDLTYETDRVNAIAGILGHLQDQGVIEGHLSGSPILRTASGTRWRMSMSWEDGFLSGIAVFSSICGGRRREEFPSWSWAAWELDRSGEQLRTVLDLNVRIWIELDRAATSILNSFDGLGVLNPLVSNSDRSNICLPSSEFKKIARRQIFKDSTCRFIRIEAPIIHCQVKRLRGSDSWIVDTVEGYKATKLSSDQELVHFPSPVDEGGEQERELLSSPLKGLFLRGYRGGEDEDYVIFVKKLDGYFEKLATWSLNPENLPFVPQFRSQEDDSIILPMWWELRNEPRPRMLLEKEIIRLG